MDENISPDEVQPIIPEAEIIAPDVLELQPLTVTYNVTVHNEEFNDFVIGVKASSVNEIRTILDKEKETKYPIHEILLAICSIAIGAFISGITAELKLVNLLGKVILIACPILAGITGTAYFFVRHNSISSVKSLANNILNKLPDPSQVKKK